MKIPVKTASGDVRYMDKLTLFREHFGADNVASGEYIRAMHAFKVLEGSPVVRERRNHRPTSDGLPREDER